MSILVIIGCDIKVQMYDIKMTSHGKRFQIQFRLKIGEYLLVAFLSQIISWNSCDLNKVEGSDGAQLLWKTTSNGRQTQNI